eukprot:Selendium_serpulae@DN4838_c0_g1_i1.p2
MMVHIRLKMRYWSTAVASFVFLGLWLPARSQMTFAALGDWGIEGETLKRTAQALATKAAVMPSMSHVVLLGDNFYSKKAPVAKTPVCNGNGCSNYLLAKKKNYGYGKGKAVRPT